MFRYRVKYIKNNSWIHSTTDREVQSSWTVTCIYPFIVFLFISNVGTFSASKSELDSWAEIKLKSVSLQKVYLGKLKQLRRNCSFYCAAIHVSYYDKTGFRGRKKVDVFPDRTEKYSVQSKTSTISLNPSTHCGNTTPKSLTVRLVAALQWQPMLNGRVARLNFIATIKEIVQKDPNSLYCDISVFYTLFSRCCHQDFAFAFHTKNGINAVWWKKELSRPLGCWITCFK